MKPATPLPWKFEPTGKSNAERTYKVPDVMDDEPYENLAPSIDNAAYIVHACNNYPRLVDWVKSHIPEGELTETDRFLRELGETP